MRAAPENRLGLALVLCLLSTSCGSDGSPKKGNADAGQQDGGAGGAGGSGGTSTGGKGGAPASGGSTSATGGTSAAGGTSDHDAGRDAAPDRGAPDASAPHDCAPPLAIGAPWPKLSQTGCMDAANPRAFASTVVPYEVNSPLWSDSADKLRGMRLPAGGKIHVKDCVKTPAECTDSGDDGKWVLPVGTVMIKHFLFDDKFVETRLFVHFDATTWVGYSYRWDEAQTDATIVPDQRTEVMFDTGKRTVDWHYPDRVDCMTCHNDQGGPTLGPETRQMDRVVGGKNQIDAFTTMGLFESAPKRTLTALVTPYAGQLGAPPATATVDDRARSYLHANCGFCHRPDALFNNIDLRVATPLKQMNVCNVAPLKGDEGVVGALDLVPKSPDKSILWIRMQAAQDQGRMPKLATYVVDNAALTLISDWITGIKSCP